MRETIWRRLTGLRQPLHRDVALVLALQLLCAFYWLENRSLPGLMPRLRLVLALVMIAGAGFVSLLNGALDRRSFAAFLLAYPFAGLAFTALTAGRLYPDSWLRLLAATAEVLFCWPFAAVQERLFPGGSLGVRMVLCALFYLGALSAYLIGFLFARPFLAAGERQRVRSLEGGPRH